MRTSDIAQLTAGERLLLRKWDSVVPEFQSGIVLQVIKVVKRYYGPVLVALWNDDEVEFRFEDYLECFERI